MFSNRFVNLGYVNCVFAIICTLVSNANANANAKCPKIPDYYVIKNVLGIIIIVNIVLAMLIFSNHT